MCTKTKSADRSHMKLNYNLLKLGKVKLLPKIKILSLTFLLVLTSMAPIFSFATPSALAASEWEFITNGNFTHPEDTAAALTTNGYIPVVIPDKDLNGSNNLSKRFSSLKVSFKYQNVGMGETNIQYLWQPYGVYDQTTTLKTLTIPNDSTVRQEELEFSIGNVDQISFYINHGTGKEGGSLRPSSATQYIAISDFTIHGKPKNTTPATPSAPSLTSPANNALIDYNEIKNGTIKLQFTPEAGTAKNQIEVSGVYFNKVQNKETPFAYKVTTGTYGLSGNIALNTFASQDKHSYDFIVGNEYTWKVRSSFSDIAYDATEGWGPWSSRTFTVTDSNAPTPLVAPTLTSPNSGAETFLANQTLSWQAVEGAASYKVQVAANEGFGSPTTNKSNVQATSLEVNFPYDFLYYWRVKAVAADGTEGPWSEVWQIRKIAQASPERPVLISPVGVRSYTGTPELKWEKSIRATSYSLEVSTDINYSNIIYSADNLSEESHTIGTTLANDTTYFWRVKAHNQFGQSSWSINTWFIVNTKFPILSDPALLTPANDSITTETLPTFSWKPVEGANTYKLIIYDVDHTDATWTWSCTTSQTSCKNLVPMYGAPNELKPDGRYFWMVYASASSNPANEDPEGAYWSKGYSANMFKVVSEDENQNPADDENQQDNQNQEDEIIKNPSNDEIIQEDSASNSQSNSSPKKSNNLTNNTPNSAQRTNSPNNQDIQRISSARSSGTSTPSGLTTQAAALNNSKNNEEESAEQKIDEAPSDGNPSVLGANTSDKQDNNDAKEQPFLVLGWWWVLVILMVLGATMHFQARIPKKN